MVATEHLDSAPVCFGALESVHRACLPVSLHGAPRERVVCLYRGAYRVEALKLKGALPAATQKSRNGRGFGFIAANVGALNTRTQRHDRRPTILHCDGDARGVDGLRPDLLRHQADRLAAVGRQRRLWRARRYRPSATIASSRSSGRLAAGRTCAPTTSG